jgi:adenine-specific DNA-methyltransferase
MIKYLGSKRLLVPAIVSAITALPRVSSVVDLFSGTSRVGHACKRAGLRVSANDHNAYAHVLGRCYVQADAEQVADDARRLLVELASVRPDAGWFTRATAEDARYFRPHNAARIEAIRDAIANKALEPDLEAVLLTSLMEAADRVDSTVGVQMAYLKAYAKRADNPLELRLPDVLPQSPHGKGRATCLDALEAAKTLSGDVAYLDPPYNQHKYLGNYHVWETLIRWDEPATYGIANKRVDVKTRGSDFNRKRACVQALTNVLDAVDARYVVVSFSDEGYVSREQIEALLARRGPVRTVSYDHPRYVGAKIGIYDPQGNKVGTPGHLRNREHLFVAGPA